MIGVFTPQKLVNAINQHLFVCLLVGLFEIQLLNIYQPLNDIPPFPLDCGGPEVTLNMDTLQLQLRLYYWISEKFYLNPPFLKVA